MTTIIARATRSGDWWAIEFEAPTGSFHTQSRRLDLAPAMVSGILAMEGVHDAHVGVVAHMTDSDQEAVDAARRAAASAATAVEEAAARSRAAVATLRAGGMTVRDVGVIMGISPQRVSQLAN